MGNAHIQARLAKGWAPDDPLLHVSFAALASAAGAKQLGPGILAEARPGHPRRTPPGRPRQAVGTRRRRRHAADGIGPDPVDRPAGRHGRPRPARLPAHRLPDHHGDGHRHAVRELKELRIGCRRITTTGAGLTRYRLAGKLIKGQGLGGTDEEWVVVEEADRAVALAEQLCDDATPVRPVFGRFAFAVRYPRFRDLGQRPRRAAPGPGPDPRRPGEPADDAQKPRPGTRLPARRAARREDPLEARQRGDHRGLQCPARRCAGQTARRDRRARGRPEPEPGP